MGSRGFYAGGLVCHLSWLSQRETISCVDCVACELCGREVGVHESYVVHIDVFAEPSMKPVSGEESSPADVGVLRGRRVCAADRRIGRIRVRLTATVG